MITVCHSGGIQSSGSGEYLHRTTRGEKVRPAWIEQLRRAERACLLLVIAGNCQVPARTHCKNFRGFTGRAHHLVLQSEVMLMRGGAATLLGALLVSLGIGFCHPELFHGCRQRLHSHSKVSIPTHRLRARGRLYCQVSQ